MTRIVEPGPRKQMPQSRFTPSPPDHKPDPSGRGVGAPLAGVAAPATTVPSATGQDDVLARAQAGDHQAFSQLYSLHKRRIYSLCLRMVGNIAEAEDLAQEAFLQLHRKIATFRGDSAFSTWLHRLAVNVVLMQLRKKGLSLISLDEAMEPSPEEGPSRSFGAPDLPLSAALDRLDRERRAASLQP